MSGSLKMAKLDFFTMKSQLVTYFSLVAIIAIFEFMSSSLMMLCLTAAWFIALFSTNIFVVQEKNNLDLLYGSLSLRLKEIVAGRYFSILLNYLLAFSMVIVVHAAAALLTGKPFDFAGAPAAFGVSLLVFSAIVGVQVPLFFKMGYIKAKGWAMLPFLAVMALVASPVLSPRAVRYNSADHVEPERCFYRRYPRKFRRSFSILTALGSCLQKPYLGAYCYEMQPL